MSGYCWRFWDYRMVKVITFQILVLKKKKKSPELPVLGCLR